MTGVAIGLVTIPQQTRRRELAIGLAVCAVAANVPDFRCPHWGHQDYVFSHSIFVNGAIILLLGLVVAITAKTFGISWRMHLAWAAAWLSHLLLDSFYNHGKGIKIFWPFSDAALVLPMPWFRNIDVNAGLFAPQNLSEYWSEFLFFGMVLLVALLARCWRSRAKPALPKDIGVSESHSV